MNLAFKTLTGHNPKLKAMESFNTDFRIPFTLGGDVDKDALRGMFQGSIHDQFVDGQLMRIN
jgi:hypothetical protein